LCLEVKIDYVEIGFARPSMTCQKILKSKPDMWSVLFFRHDPDVLKVWYGLLVYLKVYFI